MEYVQFKDGVYRITNSRVSLDSVVDEFLSGTSPETIAKECFPVLSLEQVYGAITFYLANQSKINEYLKKQQSLYQQQLEMAKENDSAFYKKLEKIKANNCVTK